MFELIYCSNIRPNVEHSQINDILKESLLFNEANDITGCLIFYNNEFIQILEGEEKVILELYGRIQTDSRHHNVTLLVKSNKKERSFKDWNMAFIDESSDNITALQKELFVNNINSLSEYSEKPTKAIRLFWNLVAKLINTKG
jgi:hypothetical protein